MRTPSGMPDRQGWLAADAGEEAPTGVSACGTDGGWLVTTEAGGSEGSEAGATGIAAAEAEPEGTTTAVAGGESGVCFVQATKANDAAANARTRLAFIDLLLEHAAFDCRSIEGYPVLEGMGIGSGRLPQ